MEIFDWTVVALYFAIIALIAWWSSKNQKDTKDYFLAGRHTAWFVVGASLFASNIGSEHIVSCREWSHFRDGYGPLRTSRLVW